MTVLQLEPVAASVENAAGVDPFVLIPLSKAGVGIAIATAVLVIFAETIVIAIRFLNIGFLDLKIKLFLSTVSMMHFHIYTVKPVYNGYCISRSPLYNSQVTESQMGLQCAYISTCVNRSPLYNSQVTESQMGLQCAFQPALTGHLSITARLLSPKWVYSVHFNLR